MGIKRLDLVGKKFGRLLVLRDVGTNRRQQSSWLCRCDCGNKHIVGTGDLMSGNTQSCGCLQRESVIEVNRGRIGEHHPNYKHGMSRTTAYRNQKTSEYKARKLNQTPADASMVGINKIYAICSLMNKISINIKWLVAHIKPLSKGGLHHPDNL